MKSHLSATRYSIPRLGIVVKHVLNYGPSEDTVEISGKSEYAHFHSGFSRYSCAFSVSTQADQFDEVLRATVLIERPMFVLKHAPVVSSTNAGLTLFFEQSCIGPSLLFSLLWTSDVHTIRPGCPQHHQRADALKAPAHGK